MDYIGINYSNVFHDGITPYNVSEHFPIFRCTKLNGRIFYNRAYETVIFGNFNMLNNRSSNDALHSIDWPDILVSTEVNAALDNFYDKLHHGLLNPRRHADFTK